MLVNFGFGICFILGYLLGYVIDPDLDIVTRSDVETRMIKKFKVLGWVYVGYWWVYAKIFPHRSFLSHFPGVSTAIRLVYAFWWFFVLLVYFDLWSNTVLLYIIWVWIGLTVADGLHWFLDQVF